MLVRLQFWQFCWNKHTHTLSREGIILAQEAMAMAEKKTAVLQALALLLKAANKVPVGI